MRAEIKPEMGRITVKKADEGVSWGGVHWQYLEDMRKITSHEGTPLKLKKALFIKETTKEGPVLKPVTGPVAVGDELVEIQSMYAPEFNSHSESLALEVK